MIGTLALASAAVVPSPPSAAAAQEYVGADGSRFGFAQTYLGVELRYRATRGWASFPAGPEVRRESIPTALVPRFTVGGTHFWGRADFFVNFPLASIGASGRDAEARAVVTTGSEVGARVYPWRLVYGGVRPFLGASWASIEYRQESEAGRGPTLTFSRVPVQAGLVWLVAGGMLELGAQWTPGSEIDYPIARDAVGRASLPASGAWVAYKYLFDATAERGDPDGGGVAKEEARPDAGGSLNAISVAVGAASAVPVTASTYTGASRPYLEAREPADIFPDLGVGYYHRDADAAVRVAYRSIRQDQAGYGTEQRLRRRSLSLEAFKFLGDYHGFVPFVGASVGLERLAVEETDRGTEIVDRGDTRWAPGVVFGWDIRPRHGGWWVLRTNLRYTPGLDVDVARGQSIAFDHLEFDFIQLVVYPERLAGASDRTGSDARRWRHE